MRQIVSALSLFSICFVVSAANASNVPAAKSVTVTPEIELTHTTDLLFAADSETTAYGSCMLRFSAVTVLPEMKVKSAEERGDYTVYVVAPTRDITLNLVKYESKLNIQMRHCGEHGDDCEYPVKQKVSETEYVDDLGNEWVRFCSSKEVLEEAQEPVLDETKIVIKGVRY